MIKAMWGRRPHPFRAAMAVGAIAWIAALIACTPRAQGGHAPAAGPAERDPTRIDTTWRDLSAHQAGHVLVDGVRLHFLDWGGSGDVLLFLAGNGNTAHVFDEFAPRFTDRFRVLALTRRGFGESDRPDSGYSRTRLVADIKGFLDSLGLGRVHLVGHSLAGDELTRFAGTFPDRVNKLVYLDAAYDRTLYSEIGPPPLPIALPPMTADEASSYEGYAAYQTRSMLGFALPAGEIHSSVERGPDGRLRTATHAGILRQIQQAREKPDYRRVTAPALAIYWVPSEPVDGLPQFAHDPSALDRLQLWRENQLLPAIRRQIDLFRSEMQRGSVVELSGTHHIFISRPGRVERLIRDFLAES